MRLRRLALAVGLASAFSANMAAALGLGEIKLQSNLNQPLRAEIRLLQVRDLSEDQILIGLASKDEFQRAGIDRPFLLTDLRFEVDLNASGGPVIRITSRNPVREPYLNFLLQSQWPNGRILREYTVLLDLPVFSGEEVEPLTPAASGGGTSERSKAPQRASPERPATRSPGAASDEVYGPVAANDTLWDIALKVRPSRQYSVHKTMLAIQRLNPEAFINGNINLLRRGHVLRVPQAAEIDTVSQQQAISEVALQNDRWSADQDQPATGAQLDATGRAETSPGRDTVVEGRLKVSGDSDAASKPVASGRGARGSNSDAVQAELAGSLEELDKARRENSDLQDRVRKLEEQIKTMERLVDVSNQELRALQLQAGKDKEREDAAAAPVVAAPVAGQASSPRPDGVDIVREGPQQEKGWLGFITANILYIGGAIVAILAAILLLLRRSEEPEVAELPLTRAPTKPDVNTAARVRDDDELDDELLTAGSAALFGEEPVVEEQPVRAPVESQTDDVVGEADIYIAYGKLEQAREMLLRALENDPENSAVRLKLMEVYAETNDRASFDTHYARIVTGGDEAAVARANELRLQFGELDNLDDELDEFPALADADGDGPMAFMDDEETLQGQNKDAVGSGEEAPLDLVLDEAGGAEDTDFEFNLDLDLDDDDTLADDVALLDDDSLQKEKPAGRVDFNLDFDSEPAQDKIIKESQADAESGLESELSAAEAEDLDSALSADDSSFELDLDDERLTADAEPESAETELDFELSANKDIDLAELDKELGVLSDDAGKPAPKSQASDEELFSAALADLPTPEEVLADDSGAGESGEDDEFDFLADTDETATKLDLARAYIDMGDHDGARDILGEVVQEGSDEQRRDAEELISRLG